MALPRAAVRFVMTAAGALALAACSSGPGAVAPDGGGPGAPVLNCQQIRMCVFAAACADDACVQRCAAKGTPPARTAFEALRACTAKACPTVGDVNCTCGEQCQADGTCLHESDVCVGSAPVDDICDAFCA